MNREEISRKNMGKLFDGENEHSVPEFPEFQEIRDRFIFGEVYTHGNLSDTERSLITLVCLTAGHMYEDLPSYTKAALKTGTKAVEITEALYQCAPYIGFPRTQTALELVSEVFENYSISLPLESQKTGEEETRLSEGIKAQKAIFGSFIDTMRAAAPKEVSHVQDYLSAFCFGDIYTRRTLDLKMRELLTFSILITIGGCESQVKSHIGGNVQMGNSRETLISAITQCLPFIGFPRTLNALTALNEVLGPAQ